MPPDGYEIRPYQPADKDSFLALYEHVHGEAKSDAWFAWKYTDNPFLSGTPMMVAEHEGRFVGARPLFALPLRIGHRRLNALQPADAMVHPDHRRQGVFTAMVEAAVDQARSDGIDLLFTFPNAQSGGAYRKLGWQSVGTVPECYRIERPGTLLAAASSIARIPGLPQAVTRGVEGARRSRSPAPAPVGIRTHIDPGAPTESLSRLYAKHIPEEIHADRRPSVIDWRYGNPDWSYRTLLGYLDGDLSGAIVTGTREKASDVTVTRCVDLLPLAGGQQRDSTLERLLHDVLASLPESTLFVLPGNMLPNAITGALGFRRGDTFPTSTFSHPTDLLVEPLSGRIAKSEVSRFEMWRPTFFEYDTS